ncbi:MAG: AgrD family cyclic lactone autoinducer peptide [Bacillota bacterium]
MLRKMKFGLLSAAASLALLVGVLGVQLTSALLFYQPEVPEHFRDN